MMNINQLLEGLNEDESPQNLVVIYAGRFQIFHKGHKAIWDSVVKNYNQNNCWIATSNKVEPPKSPFSFEEKLEMMKLTGVDTSRVVQTKMPYRPNEILDEYDPENTVAKFVVGEKDMETDPRFSFKPKKDGSPSYFQSAEENKGSYQPLNQHAYIITAPNVDFNVLGEPASSSTELRKQYSQIEDDETAKKFINDLFGDYNDNVKQILNENLRSNQEQKESINEAIYPGHIGISEIFDFLEIADDNEKETYYKLEKQDPKKAREHIYSVLDQKVGLNYG